MAKKMKNSVENEMITTGWEVPTSVKRSFTEFCTAGGSIIKEDCAGALIIWQHLPAQVRESARREAKGLLSSVEKDFWVAFEAGLNAGILAQLNIQKQTRGKK